MARNKAKGNNGDRRSIQVGNGENGFRGFIRHTITNEEKARYDGWGYSDDDLWADIQRLVDSGYSVSFKWDEYNEAHQCSFKCSNKKDVNDGWCMVARAPDIYNAIRLALYKHLVLMEGDWSAWHEREREKGGWG